MTVTPGTSSQPGQDGRHPGRCCSRPRPPAGPHPSDARPRPCGGVELGHLVQHGLDDQGAQVVGTAVDQRALVGPADRGAAGGDDDGFGHGDGSSVWIVGALGPRPGADLQVTGW